MTLYIYHESNYYIHWYFYSQYHILEGYCRTFFCVGKSPAFCQGIFIYAMYFNSHTGINKFSKHIFEEITCQKNLLL